MSRGLLLAFMKNPTTVWVTYWQLIGKANDGKQNVTEQSKYSHRVLTHRRRRGSQVDAHHEVCGGEVTDEEARYVHLAAAERRYEQHGAVT